MPYIRAYYENRWGKLPISPSEYNALIKEFNDRVFNEIVLQGHRFNIPGNLGEIVLTSRTPTVIVDNEYKVVRTNMPINHQATKELWERDPAAKEMKIRIYHDNVHTDGLIYSIKWLPNKRYKSHWMSAYKFVPSRNNRRNLATKLKSK